MNFLYKFIMLYYDKLLVSDYFKFLARLNPPRIHKPLFLLPLCGAWRTEDTQQNYAVPVLKGATVPQQNRSSLRAEFASRRVPAKYLP